MTKVTSRLLTLGSDKMLITDTSSACGMQGPRAQTKNGNERKSTTHPPSSSDNLDDGDPLQMKDNSDSLASRANAQGLETDAGSAGTPDFEKMEKMFNEALFKHMALCRIVKVANVCLRHIVGFSLLVTLPIICLTLYTFINRGLDLGNMLFNISNFLSGIIFEVIGLGLGLVINESVSSFIDIELFLFFWFWLFSLPSFFLFFYLMIWEEAMT